MIIFSLLHHQHVQVPKMEVLNRIRLFWGGFSLTLALHTAYIGEYLHFRYLTGLGRPQTITITPSTTEPTQFLRVARFTNKTPSRESKTVEETSRQRLLTTNHSYQETIRN